MFLLEDEEEDEEHPSGTVAASTRHASGIDSAFLAFHLALALSLCRSLNSFCF
jgi:hypothetical protein